MSVVRATLMRPSPRVDHVPGLHAYRQAPCACREVCAEVKRCAVLEVQIKGGYGVQEARSLVGLALAQHRFRGVITEGMRRGEASWPLVQHFWQGSGQLTEEKWGTSADELVDTLMMMIERYAAG